MKRVNKQSHICWVRDKGDQTLMLDHELSTNSIVIDIGAYTGVWISQMISKYKCFYYALEPVEKYYSILKNKFKHQDRVKCFPVGISSCNETRNINISGDGSSALEQGNAEITLYNFKYFLEMENIEKVDLVQINIEGMEYEVLYSWINSEILNKIDKLLIQFHDLENIDAQSKREEIQDYLKASGFRKYFDYPFVWEGWVRI